MKMKKAKRFTHISRKAGLGFAMPDAYYNQLAFRFAGGYAVLQRRLATDCAANGHGYARAHACARYAYGAVPPATAAPTAPLATAVPATPTAAPEETVVLTPTAAPWKKRPCLPRLRPRQKKPLPLRRPPRRKKQRTVRNGYA